MRKSIIVAAGAKRKLKQGSKQTQGKAREPFLREGDVRVARFEAARPLAEALRATHLEMRKLRLANAGRSPFSPQFAQRVRAVVEGFEELRSDLQKQRDAITRMWTTREAQLTSVTTGMLAMVGDLQGIWQGAVGQLASIAVLPVTEEIET